jgi:hypothetical protein
MLKKIYFIIIIACTVVPATAQKISYDEQVRNYISQFKEYAMLEQLRSGVPASITLAQGVLETGAGSSELCGNAQNHFGIKCKNTCTYTDDAKDECFRKYESALHSYKDHSDFLKTNKRYASLFNLAPTDYKGWAHGLKKCGYATNPKYAHKLIELIERYQLQDYTYAALDRTRSNEVVLAAAPSQKVAGEFIPEHDVPLNSVVAAAAAPANEWEIIPTSNPITQEQVESDTYYEVTRLNGLRGFYARKGDMLLEYAIKNKVRYSKLLELNDLSDAPLEADMFIYLERKRKVGNSATHVVEEGETLLQISQREGIQLAQLKLLNRINGDEEPVPGSVLNLQSPVEDKPNVYTGNIRNSEERLGFGYGAARSKPATSQAADAEWVETKKAVKPGNERIIDDEDDNTTNIASLKAVEEETPKKETTPQLSPSVQPSKNTAPATELDKLKAKMDRSVYSGNTPQTVKPVASTHDDDDDEFEDVTTVPAHVQSEINRNPEAALRNHMKQVEQRDFTPKRNPNHEQIVRERVVTPKASPAKKTNSKAKAAKKGTASKAKASASKSGSSAKAKSPAKGKATAKKPAGLS